jgi:tRNA(Arg) A34 adenosine deaminase TadA
MRTDEDFMRLAIQRTREGIEQGQNPFGACVVRGDEVICCEHGQVWAATDITAHAEVTALRVACKKLNTIDLSGCVVYSTCAPCPMCFTACHWARVARVVYGALVEDAAATGFSELTITPEQMKEWGGSPVAVAGGVLAAECRELFALWKARPGSQVF